ncbi:MAG: hypothetical protein JJ714_07500 [Acidithiobacillus sp.]|nr:hypothetical protein [Acidithiobacillus sp.]
MPAMGTITETANPHKPLSTSTRKHVCARTGLADALFSTTQQRVLALLFGQPERSFFTNELIGLAGAGSGAVQRELRRLAESGLVTIRKVGNQKHYRANPEAPIFQELCGIVTKTLGPAEVVRAVLESFGDQIRLALVYGSVATHSDTAMSDIDLLLVSDSLALEEVYAALTPAEQRLGRRISPTLYNLEEYRKRRTSENPFLTKILRGKIVLLRGDPDAILAAG